MTTLPNRAPTYWSAFDLQGGTYWYDPDGIPFTNDPEYHFVKLPDCAYLLSGKSTSKSKKPPGTDPRWASIDEAETIISGSGYDLFVPTTHHTSNPGDEAPYWRRVPIYPPEGSAGTCWTQLTLAFPLRGTDDEDEYRIAGLIFMKDETWKTLYERALEAAQEGEEVFPQEEGVTDPAPVKTSKGGRSKKSKTVSSSGTATRVSKSARSSRTAGSSRRR